MNQWNWKSIWLAFPSFSKNIFPNNIDKIGKQIYVMNRCIPHLLNGYFRVSISSYLRTSSIIVFMEIWMQTKQVWSIELILLLLFFLFFLGNPKRRKNSISKKKKNCPNDRKICQIIIQSINEKRWISIALWARMEFIRQPNIDSVI